MIKSEFTLSSGEALNYVPEEPSLTALRTHGWSWAKQYKVFESVDELNSFIETQVSDSTTGGWWYTYENYLVVVANVAAIREANRKAWAEKIAASKIK